MIAQSPSASDKAATFPCICCGTECVDRGGYCMTCQTPLKLSRSVAERGAPARFVSVLGPSGAGKTVYLGVLLDILSKGARGLRGLPNGSFSVAVQQQTITALEHRRFPEKTPFETDSWQWVHCEVTSTRRPKDYLDIITPDFAGEAIAMELERPESFPAIRSVIGKSEALLCLFDSQRVRDSGREEDFFAMKLASYIAHLRGQRGLLRKRKIRLPVAIVFTKADCCPEAIEDPRSFANSNMPGLVQACQRSFADYHFFAAGVVGSSATVRDELGRSMRIPLHVQPHGILEPLEWIMTRL